MTQPEFQMVVVVLLVIIAILAALAVWGLFARRIKRPCDDDERPLSARQRGEFGE